MKTYPLTQTQLGMFLEWNGNRAGTQYNTALAHRFPKAVDADRLARALAEVVAAEETLRMRLVDVSGEIRQFACEGPEAAPVVRRQVAAGAVPGEIAAFVRPFDPFAEATTRLLLLETPEDVWLLADTFHLFTDGSSIRQFNRLVAAAYAAGAVPPAAGERFLDYALRESALFETEDYRAAAAACRERFANVEMTLPDDAFAGRREGTRPAVFLEASSYIDRAPVEAFCQARKIHPNLFFMGVFVRTLSVFSNAAKVAFQTINHGRQDPADKTTLGAFVKTLPVLGTLEREKPLADFLSGLRLHRAGAYPFTHFCRDLGVTPGFTFAFQDGTVDFTVNLGGILSESKPLVSGGAGLVPAVGVYGESARFECRLDCQVGRYSEDFLKAFAERFRIITENFLAHPDAALGDIPVVTAAEAAEAVALARGSDLAYDLKETFLDLFRARVAEQPERTALVDCETRLTYAQADRRSDALAVLLRDRGVACGDFVGLMLPRRVLFPLAFLAVQKCGAGYVPLDPEYPADRLAYMLENSEAPVLVTTHALFDAKAIGFAGKVVFLDETDGEAPVAVPPACATPEAPAYMIYTSGSTGKPKGVVIRQKALRALLAWWVREMPNTPESRTTVIASFSFDASVPDLFATLAAGGELHILSEQVRMDLKAIRDYVAAHGITGMTASTQLGLALLNAYPEIPLDYMLVGGEKILPFAKTAVRVVNGYGPTEFTVCSSFARVDQENPGDIPIGRAVPNSFSFVVDALGQLLPAGFTGELALAGAQLSEGYWRLPEKTAAAFVPVPFAAALAAHLFAGLPAEGLRMYRTGDYARYNARGELDYLGRIDFQVKLRGFRIEIGEIEHAAKAVPGVGAVVADVREVAGAKHLVLYYEGDVPADRIKAKMAETLTGYMVPDFFVALAKMPLTPGGKIDRRALPAPALSDEPCVAPVNDRERAVFEAVAAVLKTDRFGVTHDFNRLGLTSLGAMALLAKLARTCGLNLSLKDLEKHPSVRALAALKGEGEAAEGKVRRRPRRASYPLTENQRGVYADWLRNPGATQYNVPAVFRFENLAPEKLARAAEKTVAAHPGLKARFGAQGEEIVQFRRDGEPFAVAVETLAAEPDAAFFDARVRPFASAGEDLARLTVYAAPRGTYLFLDIHHTVFDGFSLGVFLSDLSRALRGEDPVGEDYTAFDAALDDRDYLESEELADDDAFFARYLEGAESTRLEPSASGAVPAAGTVGRAAVTVAQAAIADRCRALGVTPSDYFMTVFMELLRRTGREEDIVIAFVTAGRTRPETASTVGMFARTLPIRAPRAVTTFPEAVRRVRADARELIARERASFVRLAEKFGLRPEILFVFEGGIFDLPDGATLMTPATRVAKAPLSVTVTPKGEDFELAFEYDAALYAQEDMTARLSMFRTLAEAAVTGEDLRDLPLVTADEAARILAVARGEALSYDAAETFVDLVRAWAVKTPARTAVTDGADAFTYAELVARANALAGLLAARGVGPGSFAGLMLPRRASFVVSLLAVQTCGAGYVPLDAEYPADRLAYMLENSEAPVLVTTHALFDAKGLDFKGAVIFFEDLPAPAGAAPEMPSRATPASPAYMIYTSGSTGRPKGVVVPHAALRNLIAWTIRDFGLTPAAVTGAYSSFSFDASVIDIAPVLAAGGELHVYGEEMRKDLAALRDYIVAHKVVGGVMSTQIGMALLDAYPDIPLKYLMLGGEKLLPVAKTAVRIFNGYGPTEFAVCSSYHVVDQAQAGDIPIGRAVANTYSVIVDRYGHLLPLGTPGELALAGPQLAEGYWRLPEKTAAAFVKMPFALPDQPEDVGAWRGRMYRTGDLARYNGEGTLDYLGRLDFQVKLRGFRIEFGEIEHAAASFPGVGMVAAEVREVAGAKHLVLYYAAEGAVDEAGLKAHLTASLAAYMVPDFFVRMPAMPLTPNGKINRRILPAPEGAAKAEEYVAPATPEETAIAAVYGEVLHVGKFGATTDFFAAGGTSLVGIKAVVALQKRNFDVQYGDIFKYKTPRALAAFLTGVPAPAAAAPAPGGVPAPFDYGAYDYKAIDALLAKTRTELFEGFRRHALGDVLLTGATGYLGIHVLKYLLETTDATVYALVRPRHGMAPARRLDQQYVYYFGERLPRRFSDRIAFVAGDITDGDLAAKLDGLFLNTVINCAALVKHYVADDLMDRINVGGVENLIAWCVKSGARLVHTSTYSVGGVIRADAARALDERTLYLGQESDNDYVRTKFLAERAVLAAVAEGRLRGKIMRLGNLMGREADGEFQMNAGANAFVNALKSYRALGVYPLEQLAAKIEMSPIDRVAEAVCLLATTPDDMYVFHPYNGYALDMGAVIAALNRRGYAVDAVSRGEYAAHVEAMKADPARAEALQGVLHYAVHILVDRKTTPAVNDFTTTVLYRLGFRWRPADDAYLANFFEMLEGLAVFG